MCTTIENPSKCEVRGVCFFGSKRYVCVGYPSYKNDLARFHPQLYEGEWASWSASAKKALFLRLRNLKKKKKYNSRSTWLRGIAPTSGGKQGDSPSAEGREGQERNRRHIREGRVQHSRNSSPETYGKMKWSCSGFMVWWAGRNRSDVISGRERAEKLLRSKERDVHCCWAGGARMVFSILCVEAFCRFLGRR
ncbi:hypothetical protein TNCV_4129831 [Trichonephila clavipes]|nr:hypothetical protein TNCV_4129831 [Trichonephila clavipes]